MVSCSLISILDSSLGSSLVQCLDSLGVIDTVGGLCVVINSRRYVSVFVLLLHTKYLNLLLLVFLIGN